MRGSGIGSLRLLGLDSSYPVLSVAHLPINCDTRERVDGGECRRWGVKKCETAIFLFVRRLALPVCRFDSRPRHALSLLSLIYKGFWCGFR